MPALWSKVVLHTILYSSQTPAAPQVEPVSWRRKKKCQISLRAVNRAEERNAPTDPFYGLLAARHVSSSSPPSDQRGIAVACQG